MHAHDHSHGTSNVARLRVALFVTLLILGIEIFGGPFARSLALLTDAAHMLTDVAATGLALWAAAIAGRAADKNGPSATAAPPSWLPLRTQAHCL